MRRRLSLSLTLAAWLLATGSHWDLVQTFAWGKMIASYSQEMTLGQAVKKTFSPETMCQLCHAVANAKQSSASGGSALPAPKSPGKILLVCAPLAPIYASPSPQCVGLPASLPAPLSAGRAAPPSPPPRPLV
jgi:hypothetical protein